MEKRKTSLYKEVDSLCNVDYSDMKFPMAVVYNNPTDFPGKTIARIFEGAQAQPTNVYCEYENVDKCREDAQKAGFTVVIPRNPTDDLCIVETYMF